MTSFDDFFRAATDGLYPYPYQRRLACGDHPAPSAAPTSPSRRACQSLLINVPTGLGKTAAVVLAWLWNFLFAKDSLWPRRLVYCLPMRVLVEQTRGNVATWLKNLLAQADKLGLDESAKKKLAWLAEHSPVILMGGEELDECHRDWDIYPEKPAILIGTQDMLLSRALNRGYGMSRYRWPMHFGLLNNDCLWVLDEVQLMGVGLETSAQLAGFSQQRFGQSVANAYWWMSATIDASRMQTPEAPPVPSVFELADDDRALPAVDSRLNAAKRVQRAPLEHDDGASGLAEFVVEKHVSGTLTLVILNTVERAQQLYVALTKSGEIENPPLLIHSRFRPHEREALMRELMRSEKPNGQGRIVVSTQVVEAGVDVSARTLITELAPWSSMVQRFGRCHRRGEFGTTGADIFWIDVADTDSAPYRPEELDAAREILKDLESAAPSQLREVMPPSVPEPPRHIIRPKDLLELFDTTPDLAGNDLDISRFIREGDDTDCALFWRDSEPDADADGPVKQELCPVPVGAANAFLKNHLKESVWVWNPLDRRWQHPERLLPGREYWVLSKVGGYSVERGWDKSAKRPPVPPVPMADATEPDAYDQDAGVWSGAPETIGGHTAGICRALETLLATLPTQPDYAEALGRAARWHDTGKAHPVAQAAFRAANPELNPAQLWAKTGNRARLNYAAQGRPHFRHELASALAFRSSGEYAPGLPGDLIAFLIASHHGKVRLSLRSLPGEKEPDGHAEKNDETLSARGVWHGDVLPEIPLTDGTIPSITLDLNCIQLGLTPQGHPSWLEACLRLRDNPALGPFRLAWLETLLRAADARAGQG